MEMEIERRRETTMATTFYVTATVIMGGYLMVIGKNLLQPLLIAIVIYYLMNTLAHRLQRIPRIGILLPRWATVSLSVAIWAMFGWFVFQIVQNNINNVIENTQIYKDQLKINIAAISQSNPEVGKYINTDKLNGYVDESLPWLLSHLAKFFKTVMGHTVMVVLYLLFIIGEQMIFQKKLEDHFPEVKSVLDKSNMAIEKYLNIKLFVSILTALLCYGLLVWMNIDFAPFWALIIFLLNFIPTLGSPIACAFPVIMAAIQFGFTGPLAIVFFGLFAIQWVIGSILDPYLMGQKLNLSRVVILLSLTLWFNIWGVTGMLLCVPITVIIYVAALEFPRMKKLAILLSGTGKVHSQYNTDS